MDNVNKRRIALDLPISFHCWLGSRAKKNERYKLGELKILCADLMAEDSHFSKECWQDQRKHYINKIDEEELTKWVTLDLPLSFHSWLKQVSKENGQSKRDELKLICLWMQDSLN
ncbi:hypothetical protein [Morganella morganii]|uniref:hypothetical protein n=1 Tax=Morganella morganii TaxID=582 RepID=UPI00046A8762|nr:hypothetical protein [Morganella morganii]